MATFYYVEVRTRIVETDESGITDVREIHAKMRKFTDKTEALAAHAIAAAALKGA